MPHRVPNFLHRVPNSDDLPLPGLIAAGRRMLESLGRLGRLFLTYAIGDGKTPETVGKHSCRSMERGIGKKRPSRPKLSQRAGTTGVHGDIAGLCDKESVREAASWPGSRHPCPFPVECANGTSHITEVRTASVATPKTKWLQWLAENRASESCLGKVGSRGLNFPSLHRPSQASEVRVLTAFSTLHRPVNFAVFNKILAFLPVDAIFTGQ